MKARKLKDISVSYISLVTKGANKKTIIWKAAKDSDKEETEKIQNFEFAKTNEEKHMVYGIVYAPNQLDSDGDFTDAEEIEKAAYKFMQEQKTAGSIDKQHNYKPDYGYVAESWIVKKGDQLFPDEKDIGAWAVGIKVEDNDTWEQIKKGEFSGLSMAGNAHFEMQETELNKFIKMFKNLLGIEKTQKDGDEMTEKEVKDLVSTTVDEKIQAVEKSVTDKIDAISKTVNDGFEKIQKSISEKPEEKPQGETKSDTKVEKTEAVNTEKSEKKPDESVTNRLTTLEKNMEKMTGFLEGMSNAIISKSDVDLEKGDNETDIFSNVVNV